MVAPPPAPHRRRGVRPPRSLGRRCRRGRRGDRGRGRRGLGEARGPPPPRRGAGRSRRPSPSRSARRWVRRSSRSTSAAVGGLGSNPQLPAGGLVIEKLGVPGVPVVDLRQQSSTHLIAGALNGRKNHALRSRHVVREGVLDRPTSRDVVSAGTQPRLVEHRVRDGGFVRGGGFVVEVWRGSRCPGRPVREQLDVVESLRDGPRPGLGRW